jgi:hypothetical protein
MKERADFGRYGKSFQEGLCQLILEDRPFADQISEVFDINFLELKYLQLFVKKIIQYRLKYGTHPTYKLMLTIFRAEIGNENEATQRQVRDYFARIYKTEVDGKEYIKETSLDFCRKQKIKESMLKCVPLLEKLSFDEISKEINNALILGSDNNFGHDYLIDFEERFKIKTRNPISTGWTAIDDICKSGLGKCELGVVIAPTGAGKSMVLVHLGSQAIKNGKTVVHYTLELGDTVVASRYDSCITGYPLSDLHTFKDSIYETVKNLPGKLIIKEYPTKSASSKTIRNHLEKLRKRGNEPGLVIVDYGDLLRPISMQREKRNELESIYEEMRAIAQEFKCPIWTASQTNRSGLNAEVITMESISEAFNKCFVADFIFSVSRTIDDKTANSGRIFVAKNRNGPDGIIYPIFMDTSNVKIKVLPSNGDTPASVIENSAKEEAKSLREKYKKYKKDRKSK